MRSYHDVLNARKSAWDKLCTKYINRSSTSTNALDIPCLEIDDNSFDITTASSPAPETCNPETGVLKSHSRNDIVNSTKNTNDLKYLKSYVEIELRSNLKEILHRRSESRILEDDNYNLWHQKAKKELRRLQKHITKFQLKCYMTFCINMFDKVLVRHLINDLNTDLKSLLIKRQALRNDLKKFSKNNEKLNSEWKKLTNILPLEYVIFYASEVVDFVSPRTKGVHLYRHFRLDIKARNYQGKCPICLKSWIIPTVLQVSGYIFCFRCILRFLNENQKCPVTNLPARPLDIVRLYIN